MWGRSHLRRRMRAYLLGRSSEAERVRLEQAWFADDSIFEEFETAEQDLIDAHVRGVLPARDRLVFEARAASSPRLRERIAVARRLLEESDRHVRASAGEAPTPARVATRRWPRWALVMAPAAGVAVLALAAGMWWSGRGAAGRDTLTVPVRGPAPIESDRAAGVAPAREPGEPAPGSAAGTDAGLAIAVTLFPGASRGAEPDQTIPLSAATHGLELSLEYDGEASATYDVVIRTPEGRTVWERSGLSPARAGVPGVTIAVESQALRGGDYVLTLGGRTPGGERAVIAEYVFRVVR